MHGQRPTCSFVELRQIIESIGDPQLEDIRGFFLGFHSSPTTRAPQVRSCPTRGWSGAGVGVGMLSGKQRMQTTQAEDANHPSGRCTPPKRKMQTTQAEDANHVIPDTYNM